MTRVFASPEPRQATERMMLLALADAANEQGRCWPSMTLLRQKCALATVRGAEKVVARLEKQRFVRRELRSGRTTVYHLSEKRLGEVWRSPDAGDPLAPPPVRADGTPPEQQDGGPPNAGTGVSQTTPVRRDGTPPSAETGLPPNGGTGVARPTPVRRDGTPPSARTGKPSLNPHRNQKQQQHRACAPARGGEGAESGQPSAVSLKTAALPASSRALSGQLSAVSLKTAALPAAAVSIDDDGSWVAAAALPLESQPTRDGLPASLRAVSCQRSAVSLKTAALPAAAAFSKEEDQGKAHLVGQLVERGVDKAVAHRLVDEGDREHVQAMLDRGAREAGGPGWYVKAIKDRYRALARDGPAGRRRYTHTEALALLDRRGMMLSSRKSFTDFFDVVREDGRAYFVLKGG